MKLIKLKRLPLIRHVRYLYWRKQVWDAAERWHGVRIGMGVPDYGDLVHLSRIWNGKA